MLCFPVKGYMAGSRAKDATSDALTSKLESKIYYHREAVVEYVEIKAMVDTVIEDKRKLLDENTEFLSTIDKVLEEKEILQKDNEVIKELVEPMEEELEIVKDELEEEKLEHVAAKKELATAKEQLAQQSKEMKALRKKLQESEAMHAQLESPRPGMVTRFSHKRAVLLQGSPANDANRDRLKKQRSYPQPPNNPIAAQHASRDNDLEVVRQKMIKGFTEIDAGWSVGLKEMGKLNEKPFQDACADKLSPKHSGAKASELYSLWQEVLNSPNWNPFKSVIVDGNCQEEVIDVDDDKLKGLKMAWGEGPYNSVISALVERKEYNTDGTGGVFDVWNYKEGRKATLGECVDGIFDHVKKLKRYQVTYRSRKTTCAESDPVKDLTVAMKEGSPEMFNCSKHGRKS
ncbi:hypothetical protein QYE76_001540 [Lolium multiflorum]|uniref:Factor of DNA methylation 1-5/IDN2 domain-containing protein n=1 Tax=Lolium multiflorum TaxID=4521 RepID=A0AAD8VX21_LOLMU|nr:hypothetical protein QYE76_001540 [Lolium multiflorum]